MPPRARRSPARPAIPTEPPAARQLSPRRQTTQATTPRELAGEQLGHFRIDPRSPVGRPLLALAEKLYGAHGDVLDLWAATTQELARLPRADRLALVNAKQFLSHQLAKLHATLQHPVQRARQSLRYGGATLRAQGPAPVTAGAPDRFPANPILTRTEAYLHACSDWIDDTAQGREPLSEAYARLLHPASLALAGHLVDLECGPFAGDYLAWNFNSGAGALDAVLAHVVRHRDIVLAARPLDGGTARLLTDGYGRTDGLAAAVVWFDGTVAAFREALATARRGHADRLAAGRRIHVYLESPAPPHGHFLDVPALCQAAHHEGLTVLCDGTLGTSFLVQPLRHPDEAARPDFLIRGGAPALPSCHPVDAGVVLGRIEAMFIPRGEAAPSGRSWRETFFWNACLPRGTCLDADQAAAVQAGLQGLEAHLLRRCGNTLILARWLASHPLVTVTGPAQPADARREVQERLSYLGMPAPLCTIHFEKAKLARATLERFLDALGPLFGHLAARGQARTLVTCPALSTLAALDAGMLRQAGLTPSTLCITVGEEAPRELIADFLTAAQHVVDRDKPGFSGKFLAGPALDQLVDETYVDLHRRHAAAQPRFTDCLL